MNSNKLHVQQFDWLRSLEAHKVTKVNQTFRGLEKQAFYKRVSVQMASWFHQSNIRASRRDGKAK